MAKPKLVNLPGLIPHDILHGIKAVFAEKGADKIPSAELVAALLSRGIVLGNGNSDAQVLAYRLRPLGVSPKVYREGDRTFRGYLRASFAKIFKNLPEPGKAPPGTPPPPGETCVTNGKPCVTRDAPRNGPAEAEILPSLNHYSPLDVARIGGDLLTLPVQALQIRAMDPSSPALEAVLATILLGCLVRGDVRSFEMFLQRVVGTSGGSPLSEPSRERDGGDLMRLIKDEQGFKLLQELDRRILELKGEH